MLDLMDPLDHPDSPLLARLDLKELLERLASPGKMAFLDSVVRTACPDNQERKEMWVLPVRLD